MKVAIALVCWLAAMAAAEPLDFVVDKKGATFVVHDAAYTITFPGKPELSVNDKDVNGVTLKTFSSTYVGPVEVYGFLLVLVPGDAAYDVAKGMAQARDGGLAAIGGKLVREENTTMSGLESKHSVGTGTVEGVTMNVDVYVAWDDKHRALIGAFTMNHEQASKAQRDFIASFKMNPKGATPH